MRPSVRAREFVILQQVRAGHVIRHCTEQLLDDDGNFFRPTVLTQRNVRGLAGQLLGQADACLIGAPLGVISVSV